MSYSPQMNKFQKYFPTIYNLLDKLIEKTLNPIIDKKVDKRLEERTNDIVVAVDATIRKMMDDRTIKIKSNVEDLFKQLMWEKLKQADGSLKEKFEKDIAEVNAYAEKKIQEVDDKLEILKQKPEYQASTELEKLVTDICYDMEKKYPQKGMGKVKKHRACLEIDTVPYLPDKRVQWLRQSTRKIDNAEFRAIMYSMIDKIGGGL